MEKVREALLQSREVAINLSQNPLVQEHLGQIAPVLLASSTTIWGILQGRPFCPKDTGVGFVTVWLLFFVLSLF